MQVVTRHGGGSHYVRPDRVYRTGVLTSTMGYQPGQDVQAVAAAFTQYPIDLSLPASPAAAGTSGLRGPGPLGAGTSMGYFKKLALRYRLWKARRAAAAGMHGLANFTPRRAAGVRGLADFTPNAFDPSKGISYTQVGRQISPELVSKATMVNYLMSGSLAQEQAQAQAGTSAEHWWNQRWNG